jgi:hypothetical protein
MLAQVPGRVPVTRPGSKVRVAVQPSDDQWYNEGTVSVDATMGAWTIECHFRYDRTSSGTRFQIQAIWQEANDKQLGVKEVMVERE